MKRIFVRTGAESDGANYRGVYLGFDDQDDESVPVRDISMNTGAARALAHLLLHSADVAESGAADGGDCPLSGRLQLTK